jgi:hypothetical protein
MTELEQKSLKAAYNAVFDENGKVKECGRDACIRLINLMGNYTSKNVGNENTGMLEIDAMKSEYYRVIATL